MLDVAWPELIVIGAVALVAIGPKDLPKVMHSLGQWAGKARLMIGDLQRAFDQLNYETEIAEKLKRGEATPPGGDPSSSETPSTPTTASASSTTSSTTASTPSHHDTSTATLMTETSRLKP